MPILYAILAGIGLGYVSDKKKEEIYYGPLEYKDWKDRTTWYNPISGTNVDQYIIGGTILVLLYRLNSKY